ncbi:MAG: agglutinin biogenesis protein MshI [Pseudomonadota bacterium]|nr:agglutinin biogenesis protein MshI [Pseudomonadota bacterium]
MNWLKSRAHSRAHAVLSHYLSGTAALLVQGAGERVRVLAFSQHENMQFSADLLNRVAAEAGIKHSPLIALLGQEHYQTMMVEAPSVPEDEIKSAIRWKVKDLLNFHIDDAVLDHLPVPGGSGHPPSLYVVAAQAQAVRALVQPYHDAGLQLDVIDIRETAQHNLAMRVAPADYAVAVLHFDGENGLLTFSFGANLILSRRIEGRGASGEALLDKVAMESQRSVDYFERQYSWFPLAKLYLAPAAQAQALLRRLSEYLPIGAESLDLGRVFDFTGQIQLQDTQVQNAAFHLLGAALRPGAESSDTAR